MASTATAERVTKIELKKKRSLIVGRTVMWPRSQSVSANQQNTRSL